MGNIPHENINFHGHNTTTEETQRGINYDDSQYKPC